MSKLSNKSIQVQASSAIRALSEGRNGITALLNACETKAQVLLACSSFKSETETLNKNERPAITKLWQNSVSQFIARCRKGETKVPPKWFDVDLTISFSSDPYEFTPVKTRKSSKTSKDEQVSSEKDRFDKAVLEKANTLLEDKAILSKAQAAKLAKVEQAHKTELEKLQASLKTEKSLRLKAEADYMELAKEHNLKVQALDSLKRDYDKAKRQVQALEKALSMLKVEKKAVEAIMAVQTAYDVS